MWRPIRPGRVSAGSSSSSAHVAGPDEVDLLLARAAAACRRSRSLPIRCGTTYSASRNVFKRLRDEALASRGGSSMPSMTTSSWLSASPPPWPPPMPGIMIALDRVGELVDGAGRACRGGSARAREQPLAPRRGLQHEVAVRRERAVGAEEERVVHGRRLSGWKPEPSAWRRMPTASISSMNTMHWPPHLAASFFALRASQRTSTASMPMKVCAKPEPGIVTNGQLNDVAMRLGEHRLAGAGRAEEEHAALALAARLLELLARLPERDDAGDLLLGLGLAADVVELDAPVRVARLVGLDLLDAEDQHRPEQDQEVGEEQDRGGSAGSRSIAGANAASEVADRARARRRPRCRRR